MQMNAPVEASIMLTVWHGGNFLKEALASLAEMKPPRSGFEVLVAGPAGDAANRSIAEAAARTVDFPLVYIDCPDGANRSRQLNIACRRARGGLWIFAEDDCRFPPDWFETIRALFSSRPDVAMIGGLDRHPEGKGPFDLALNAVFSSFVGTGGIRKASKLRTGRYYPKLWNMALRSKAARKAEQIDRSGGVTVFDESLAVHEDVDLARRIEANGGRILHAPDWYVIHHRDTDLRRFFTRNFQMGRISRSIGVHRFAHIVLASAVLGATLLVTASLAWPVWRIPVAVLAVIYLAVIALPAVGLIRSGKGIGAAAMAMLLALLLHFARGTGYLLPWKSKAGKAQ